MIVLAVAKLVGALMIIKSAPVPVRVASPSADALLSRLPALVLSMMLVVKVLIVIVTVRGMVSQVLTVKTLDHAVHSGMFGGPLPDAMTAMIKLLATLTTPSVVLLAVGVKSAV